MKHTAKRFGKNMEEKIHNGLNKLFENRDYTENELYKHHALVLEYIENQTRSTKTDAVIIKKKHEQNTQLN